MNILFVLTSHDALGSTGEKTGFWIEELAAPYYTVADAGARITLASPTGGQPPVDPKSAQMEFQTRSTRRFDQDVELQQKLANTLPLTDLSADDFDAVFYPGGHGPLWDLTQNAASIRLIEAFAHQGKPVAAVCHAPCVLLNVKDSKGGPLLKDKNVTGFSNTEEAAVGLTDVVPFLLEDALRNCGAVYSQGPDWASYTRQDGGLITGQNPASSGAVAETLLAALNA